MPFGFFNGRYGMDRLNRTLLIAALGFSVLSMLMGRSTAPRLILSGVSVVCLAFGLFRMLSRNFTARQSELSKYMNLENRLRGLWTRLRGWWRNRRYANATDFNERKKYKYLSCPQCMQRLRVPRGKGKLRVTCTKCGCRFETKS